ncbi:hypothetical protein ACTMU2_11750 [Cupriavidus basilensis]
MKRRATYGVRARSRCQRAHGRRQSSGFTAGLGRHARERHEERDRRCSRTWTGSYEAPADLLDGYLEITLTPGNPIMHSAVVYGLIGPYGQWHARELPTPVCWWTDCPRTEGAYFLEQRRRGKPAALCHAVARRLDVDLSSVKPLEAGDRPEAYGEQIRDPIDHAVECCAPAAPTPISRAPLPVAGAAGGGYLVVRVQPRLP